MTTRYHYRLFGFITIAVALGFDQISKYLILHVFHFAGKPAVTVAPFFDLALVWNQGVSFGMLAAQNQPYALVGLSAVIVAILLVWLMRAPSMLVCGAVGSITGGAAGNIIDRLRFGAVVDFLDFHAGPYHWPAFNVADSAIFIGVVLLCLDSIVAPSKTKA